MTAVDRWGQPLALNDPSSCVAWDEAWTQLLAFRGDPLAVLARANGDDEGFVMGPVLVATYRVLGGARPESADLVADIARACRRAEGADDRSRAHVHALEALVAGNFVEAADRWDVIAGSMSDFAAVRFAHDVQLHCGHAAGRLASTSAAVAMWPPGRAGHANVSGMHAFALEELGCYDEAVEFGRRALRLDPHDAWALHALAHVFESTGDQDGALSLLGDPDAEWHGADLLATHLWWHVALRLLAAGDLDGVFEIFDRLWPTATTAFRLCDLTSLLWRVELASEGAGDRWHDLAERWSGIEERHACGFIDVHAAMAFAKVPDHPGADTFWRGLDEAHHDGTSENDATFRTVVRPVVAALRSFAAGDLEAAGDILGGVLPVAHRIGGSVVQRDILNLTCPMTKSGSLRGAGVREVPDFVVESPNSPIDGVTHR